MELSELFSHHVLYKPVVSTPQNLYTPLQEEEPENIPLIAESAKARAKKISETAEQEKPSEPEKPKYNPILPKNSNIYLMYSPEVLDEQIKKTIDRIVKGGYATSSSYKDNLLGVVKNISKLKGANKDFYELAYSTYKNKGVSEGEAIVYAAQDCLESGYGKKASGKNNYGGIKGKGTVRITHEEKDGKRITKRAEFRDFTSFGDYADYKINLLNKPRYNQV